MQSNQCNHTQIQKSNLCETLMHAKNCKTSQKQNDE